MAEKLDYGYMLPSGAAYTEDMRCCFVFVPDRDEYQRAFFGALDYFGTWIAWERDDDKRGKDAARAWKLANELTRECWDMGACDLMLEKLDELIALQSGVICCPDSKYITYNDNRVETTTITVDEGDPPAYYGETAVSDWDDWKKYVCYHAHVIVDDLVNAALKIDSLLDLGIWAIDAFLWMTRQIAFRNPIWEIPVDLSWAGTIFKAILQGGAGYFEIVADDIEAGREDIVCALINGTSLGDAVEAVLDGTVAWTLFYQFMDYDTAQAVIYNGGIDEFGYLTPVQREDCDCAPPIPAGEYYPNFHWRQNGDESAGADWVWSNNETSQDGFDIDGVYYWNKAGLNYPSNALQSSVFSWPGGAVDCRVLAKCANTGTITAQKTYVVVQFVRASDHVVMDSYSTIHEDGQNKWSLEEDLTDTTVQPAGDYYIKVYVDGTDGYGGRLIDYVSIRVDGT